MKRFKIIILVTLTLIFGVLSTFQIIDNRDYKEDTLELYILNKHIGYYYQQSNEIELVNTGR